MSMRGFIVGLVLSGILVGGQANGQDTTAKRGVLDPRGKIHIPIGVANTVDTLKTFVEAEGCFSPGVGTYGIYFWAWDTDQDRLVAPTMDGVVCRHGLGERGYLIPWSEWQAGAVRVRTEVCQVRRPSPVGEVFVVGARATMTNTSKDNCVFRLIVALRPLGPAGGRINRVSASGDHLALWADDHPAVVCNEKAEGLLLAEDSELVAAIHEGKRPLGPYQMNSEAGEAAGALYFQVSLKPGQRETLSFVCPVLPGRRAVGHQWDGKNPWAQLDDAVPNPSAGGILQPDPGIEYYGQINVDQLFGEAEAYWKDLVGRASLSLPDPRWAECFAAITGHLAMCMNENAPDVAVVNYNVFNRDGMYTANVLQKAGRFELAERAIDYFLSHPFNGRIHPEADNPGQILWIMGEHWSFTHDKAWLARVYPSLKRLVALVSYYRTTPGPHWVALDSLDFGDAVLADRRKELKAGSCDGYHPEYTEAYDVSGLRKAAMLARAMGEETQATEWSALAESLFAQYDTKFSKRLPKEYGSYSVLWPCQLYPLDRGAAHEQFKGVGVQHPAGWRYFPLATAHQGLLAGNRAAGYATIDEHLKHEQMASWYAFDEGGKSGAGGWRHVRSTWNGAVAMPHGWAIAEMVLLLRDSLVFEDGNKLVLLGGVPEGWFTARDGMKWERLPTHFGMCSVNYTLVDGGAMLAISGNAKPAGGFVLRWPTALKATFRAGGETVPMDANGDVRLPSDVQTVRIQLSVRP